MPQAGILGRLDEYNEYIHQPVLRLGVTFGEYESWLKNRDVPRDTIEDKCRLLIDDINDDLEDLNAKYRLKGYSDRSLRLVEDHVGGIHRDLIRNSEAHGAYFLIGCALGILLSGTEDCAKGALKRIEVFHPHLEINHQQLFDNMFKIAIPREGRDEGTVLMEIKAMLKALRQDIVILFVSSDPKDTSRLSIQQEQKTIKATLERTKFASIYKVEFQPSCELDNLQSALLKHRPQIIQFSGHGTEEGLCFEDEWQKVKIVKPDNLANLLALAKEDGLQVVVLNACMTSDQVDSVTSKIPYVIAMNGLVGDSEAIGFTKTFYNALGEGKTVVKAFNQALAKCDFEDHPDKIKPELTLEGRKGSVKYRKQSAIPESATEEIRKPLPTPEPESNDLDIESKVIELTVEGKDESMHLTVSETREYVSRGNTSSPVESKSDETGVTDDLSGTTAEGEGDALTDADTEAKNTNRASTVECNKKNDSLETDEGGNESTDNELALKARGSPPEDTNYVQNPKAGTPPSSSPNSTARPDRPKQPATSGATQATPNLNIDALRNLCNDPDFNLLQRVYQERPQAFDTAVQSVMRKSPHVIDTMKKWPAKVIEALLEGKTVHCKETNDGKIQFTAENRLPTSPRPPVGRQSVPVDPLSAFFGNTFFGSGILFDDFMFGMHASPFATARSSFFTGPANRGPQRPGPPRQITPSSSSQRPSNNASGRKCDACGDQFKGVGYFNCAICKGGDFNVCVTCVRNNIGCSNIKHVLQERLGQA